MPVIVDGKMKFYADSEPRRLMELFSVKWTTMVIHALYHWPGGKCRTGELQRSLDGISKKMLVQSLREVERRGLVQRHVFSVVPPKVEYQLTELGRVFAEPIELMYQWGLENKAALDAMEAACQQNQGL
ncbi:MULTISPECIES: winged helix-turn-helix transcriptional regulator [Winslowiella]|uniref:winged helix-turn-helix transcriptional regulator n=1 Tax=Winslowiella TaxID=2997349 RepID=UPI0028BD58E5|nr:helix-turn-helix domain-containing protein [Winslowiella toletana]WNN42886.1 helix-turn-helix domain-containing protein [Winslowiella toletana]